MTRCPWSASSAPTTTAGFRQVAFEMEQVEAIRLASLPADERAAALVKQGDQFMNSGLTLEAEREFQSALHVESVLGTGPCRPRPGS